MCKQARTPRAAAARCLCNGHWDNVLYAYSAIYIYILAAVRCAVCVCTRESVCAHGSLVQIMAIDVRSPVLIYVRVTTSVYIQESITCSISILCNLIGLPFGFGTRAEQRVMRSKFHFSFTGVNKCSRIATCW